MESAYLDILGPALKYCCFDWFQSFVHFLYVKEEWPTEPISSIQKDQGVTNSQNDLTSQSG